MSYKGRGPRGPNPNMRRKPSAKSRKGIHNLLRSIRARGDAR